MKKVALWLIFMSLSFGMSALTIAQKAKEATDGYEYSHTTMQMILIDISKTRSIREIESYSKEGKEGEGDKSLIEFKTPLDVKGTKFLTHEKINKNNDQWLYLPALKRVKRINSSNKSGSFMGSEFSYEDISSREPTKYAYSKNIKEETIQGVKAYKYERYPKDENSGYTKETVWIDAKRFVVLKIDFYDRKDELLKTATYKWQDVKEPYRTREIVMKNHQNKKETILKFLNDKIRQDLDDSIFTKRALIR